MPYDQANISIIHLDLEGFEEYALRGARKTIERYRPLLILETVPKNLDGYRVERQLEEQSYLLAPKPTMHESNGPIRQP
jgi:hypothetical protein